MLRWCIAILATLLAALAYLHRLPGRVRGRRCPPVRPGRIRQRSRATTRAPVFGIAAAAVFLGERPSALELVGAVLICAGLAATLRPARAAAPVVAAPAVA